MPATATTLDRISKVIADFWEGDITPESKLEDDLNLDSLDKVEILMAIEEEFDIEVRDDEADKVETVAELVKLVDKNIAAR